MVYGEVIGIRTCEIEENSFYRRQREKKNEREKVKGRD